MTNDALALVMHHRQCLPSNRNAEAFRDWQQEK